MKPYEYYYLAKRNLFSNAVDRKIIPGKLKPGARIHISAVCGKATASIACMLSDAGFKITGSDFSYQPPMSEVLTAHHIDCRVPSADNVSDIDILIPGNALSPNDIEVMAAKRLGVPMMSGSEAVAELLVPNKRSLVVAGTHGKTTSSSLLAHVFIVARYNPAYLIGGMFQRSGESYSAGNTETRHVIFEGDEYDCAFFDKAPKFLRYAPTSAIITSIEHDHIDLYSTFEDYKQAFQFLAEEVPTDGFLVIHESILQNLDLSRCVASILTYGTTESADVTYKIMDVNYLGTTFSLQINGKIYSSIKIPLFGEYNVANATAVFALALAEGVEEKSIKEAFQTYPGVRERQEVIGVKKGNITVIHDFAHHPTAVSATLSGLRDRYPDQRLVCVFEPRSNTSRRKMFESIYPNSLFLADISVIIAPPFRHNDNTEDFMNVSAIHKTLESLGRTSHVSSNTSDSLKILSESVKENDVVVFMSNGDMDDLPQKFLKM